MLLPFARMRSRVMQLVASVCVCGQKIDQFSALTFKRILLLCVLFTLGVQKVKVLSAVQSVAEILAN